MTPNRLRKLLGVCRGGLAQGLGIWRGGWRVRPVSRRGPGGGGGGWHKASVPGGGGGGRGGCAWVPQHTYLKMIPMTR